MVIPAFRYNLSLRGTKQSHQTRFFAMTGFPLQSGLKDFAFLFLSTFLTKLNILMVLNSNKKPIFTFKLIENENKSVTNRN